jgi:hypothetical protein
MTIAYQRMDADRHEGNGFKAGLNSRPFAVKVAAIGSGPRFDPQIRKTANGSEGETDSTSFLFVSIRGSLSLDLQCKKPKLSLSTALGGCK